MLDHLIVLELASVLAGPSVGQFLAEQGARVIKVENPRTGGDVTRSWRLASEPPDGLSAYFCSCNFGKESIALDLSTPGGRDVLLRLARVADVVIASHAHGQAGRLGADADRLRAANPRLVHASVSGYGPDDPRNGYDAVLQAETGFMAMNGDPDGPPTKMPVALVDVLAAHQLKEAILLALLERERTGAGSAVHVSLHDAAVSALANQATNWLVAGHDPGRMGSDHPNIVPYGRPMRTADGHDVVLAVGTDAQFRALCTLLGDAEAAEDARFRTNPDRVRHREAVYARLGPLVAAWCRDDLLAALREARIPSGAVLPVSEVLGDPEHPLVLGEPAGPRGLRQTAFLAPGRPLAPPPGLGAHTRAVLTGLAGLSAEAVEGLVASGAIPG